MGIKPPHASMTGKLFVRLTSGSMICARQSNLAASGDGLAQWVQCRGSHDSLAARIYEPLARCCAAALLDSSVALPLRRININPEDVSAALGDLSACMSMARRSMNAMNALNEAVGLRHLATHRIAYSPTQT